MKRNQSIISYRAGIIVSWLLCLLFSSAVFCTCNKASIDSTVNNIEPLQLIIDDAAMVTEPEAMIPIQSACHVTLIEDYIAITSMYSCSYTIVIAS